MFSEQEGGGTNDRNEVTTGPPGVGLVELYRVHRALATFSDGKLWHYLCLCEWQTEHVICEAALTRPQLCFTGQSEATVSILNLHRIGLKKYASQEKFITPLYLSNMFVSLVWKDTLMFMCGRLWPRMSSSLILCVFFLNHPCSLKRMKLTLHYYICVFEQTTHFINSYVINCQCRSCCGLSRCPYCLHKTINAVQMFNRVWRLLGGWDMAIKSSFQLPKRNALVHTNPAWCTGGFSHKSDP